MKCRCSRCVHNYASRCLLLEKQVHNYASRCLLLEKQIKGIPYRIPNFRKCPYFKLG